MTPSTTAARSARLPRSKATKSTSSISTPHNASRAGQLALSKCQTRLLVTGKFVNANS